MITASYLWLDISLGLLAAGLVFGVLLLLTWWDWRRQAKAAAQLHVPQHRALPAAPVEVIRVAAQPTVETPARWAHERTEEWPARVEETPVEHVGASEDWSPTGELALVPERSLDPWEALEAEIAEEVRKEVALHLDPIQQQIARLGHAEQHTCEISFEHVRLAVDAERAGAL